MMKLVAAVALAAAIASPAFAQTTQQRAPAASAQTRGAPAQTPRQTHSSNAANDVYDTQRRYIGSDPDPQVRTVLQNDTLYNNGD